MKSFFVTGCTGVVGAEIVPLLLKQPENKVRVLLRANSDEHAEKRVSSLVRYWAQEDRELGTGRLVAVRGDVTLPRLGLSPATYDEVAGDTTSIIHCAGDVRMNLSLEEARKVAVSSAEGLLELARRSDEAGGLQKVEYVSTVGVNGRRQGELPETWLDEDRGFHNTYERAKAEAETIIREGVREGLPITVHRPSMVVGSSRTGRISGFQVFYHLCELLLGRRTLGLVPALPGTKLDTVPVDYVARAIVWSSSSSRANGQILNLSSGPVYSWAIDDIRRTVRWHCTTRGIHLSPELVVSQDWFRRITQSVGPFLPKRSRRSLNALPFFFDYLTVDQKFGNEKTLALLANGGISLPRPGEYIHPVLDYYFKRPPSGRSGRASGASPGA